MKQSSWATCPQHEGGTFVQKVANCSHSTIPYSTGPISRFLFQKLIVTWLVKKFPDFVACIQ